MTKINNKKKQKVYNQHDQFFKTGFSKKTFAKELLFLIFSKEERKAYDLNKIQLEKGSFPDDARADLVLSVPLKNKPENKIRIFILIEHKSQYDVKLFYQLFRYLTFLIQKSLMETGKIVPVIPVVFYHGKTPWKWKKFFQEAFADENFLALPVSTRENMLNFKVRVLDLHSSRLQKIIRDRNFKSRVLFHLLREVWFSKPSLSFVSKVLELCDEEIKSQEDIMLNMAEYLSKAYKMKQGVWRKAEELAVKRGLLNKGGYMDIKKFIAERERHEGQQVERQRVVLNMLKNKMDIKIITKVTGLSEKEIKKLKKGSPD